MVKFLKVSVLTILITVFLALSLGMIVFNWLYPINDVNPKEVVAIGDYFSLHGTAFKYRYKGKIYFVSAAHVCGNNLIKVMDYRMYTDILHQNEIADVCILKDNEDISSYIYEGYKYPKHLYRYQNVYNVGFSGKGVLTYKKQYHKIVFPYKDYVYKDQIVIETEGIFRQGNSGGPLIDYLTGQVVGIVKATYYPSSNIGIAVNIRDVNLTIDEYLSLKE